TLERVNSKITPARPMDLLNVHDKLKSEAGSEVVLVYLADGHREQIPAKATVTIGKAGCEPESAVKRLSSLKPDNGFQAGLDGIKQRGRGAATVLRGDRRAPQLSPISGATVITDRPTLAWQPVPHATKYQIELLSSGTGQS